MRELLQSRSLNAWMRGGLCALLLVAASLQAGGPSSVGGPTFGVNGSPFIFNLADAVNAGGIPYRLDPDAVAAGFAGGKAIDATRVDGMLDTWENVSTAAITFQNAGNLLSADDGMGNTYTAGTDVTTVAQVDALDFSCQTANEQSPVVIDATGALTDALLGVGASDGVLGFAGGCRLNGTTGFIDRGRAVLNGKFQDGVAGTEVDIDEFDAAIIHEFGHFFGLDHPQINVDCFDPGGCSAARLAGVPTMFPVILGPEMKTLAADDIAWVSNFYPSGTFATTHGFIEGTIFFSDGMTQAQGVNVIARCVGDSDTVAVSVVSGFLFTDNPGQSVTVSDPDIPGNNNTAGSPFGTRTLANIGFYSIPVPLSGAPIACASGEFTVEVESIHPDFSFGSSVGPLVEPIANPGADEFFNGASEANNDTPGDSTNVAVTAGLPATSGIDIILNGTAARFDAFDNLARNDSIATATPITNGTTAATISPFDGSGGDNDFYAFSATMGNTVTLEIFARRLMPASPLDPVIAVYNSAGVLQTTCRTAFDLAGTFTKNCVSDDQEFNVANPNKDSLLEFNPPSTGIFYVQVLDWRGDGRPDLRYELMVSGANATPAPDLSITKTHSGDFTPSVNGDFTLTITNVGTGPTTGTITVTDSLPAQLDFVSGTGAGWACNAVGQNVTCTNPNPLAAAAMTTITLTVNPNTTGMGISNTAVVATLNDGNAANDSSIDMFNIVAAGCDITSAQSGDWGTGTTWVGGVVPTGADDVCVESNHAVTVSTGNQAANSLTVTSSAVFTISGGTLTLSANSSIGMGGYAHSSGTLTGTGNVTVSGATEWSGGTISGASAFNPNGGLTISGGTSLTNGRTLNNNAMTTQTATLNTGSGTGATINNNGTWDLQGDFTFLGGFGGTNIFNNAGTFTKSGGAGSGTAAGAFNNTGTANANSGTLLLQGGGTSTGAFNVAATLNFSSGTHELNSGVTVSGAGTTTFSSGTVNFNAGSNITTAAAITGGTMNATANLTLPTLTISGGTLGGTGNVTVSGATAWSGGTITGASAFNPDGGLTISGGTNLTNGRTLNNNAMTTQTATLNTGSGTGATINNNGTWDLQGDFTFLGGFGGTNIFNNAGTFTKSGGAGSGTAAGAFNNTGTVNANSGTLTFNTAFTQTAGSTTLSGGNIGGGIIFNFQGGLLAGNGTVTGTINQTGGTVGPGLSAGVLNASADFTQTAGGTAQIELAGTGGPGAANGHDQINAGGNATVDGTWNVVLINGYMPAIGDSFTVATCSGGPTCGSGNVIFNFPAAPAGGVWTDANSTDTALIIEVVAVGAGSADLSVTKVDSPDPVFVGGTLTYTVTVNNAGPDTADNLTVTDTLPAGVTFVSAMGTGWTCNEAAGVVTCTRASLAVGAAPDITITVTAPSAAGTITNNVTVASTTADPVAGNNSDSEDTTVNPSADLSITKTDAPDPVIAGTNLTYTLAVNNLGPSDATNVSVTDTLPAGLTFVSASGTGWTCGEASGTVTCTRAALAVGAAPDITIAVTVNPDTRGTLTNTASVTATEADPAMGNNSDSEDTTVAAQADLAVTKTDAPDPVLAGQNLTYTLTVTNSGPSTATNVTATDVVPAGLNFVSAMGSQGACTLAAGTITCAVGTLAPGANATATVVVTPTAAGMVSNTVNVTATETDPDTSNNSATATTTVNPAIDLAVTKTDSPDPVTVGNNLTYTVVVVNNGPSPASNVVLTDPLPANVSFVSANSTQGACSQASGTVTCNIGAMNSGAAVTVTIMVTTNVVGPLSNTASATATETDTVPGNNSATAATTVNPVGQPDFSVSASPSVAIVPAGLQGTYAVTVTPIDNFMGDVALSCSGEPQLAQCVITPNSGTLDGVNPVNATMVVNTRAGSNISTGSAPFTITLPPDAGMPSWLLALLGLAALFTFAGGRMLRTRAAWPRMAMSVAAVVLFTAFLSGCASKTGTPQGTHTITVTATSGSLTRTTTVTLVVR